MREHVRLGRIAGIPVGINLSVLVIFLLITLGLAGGRFPLLHPGYGPIAYALAGLTAGLIFFLSLLAHELAHALVARRNGVGVEGITLWLFGGVARLTGEASDPGAELRIAGVGPLVSLLLGAAFFLVAGSLGALGAAGLVVDVFLWLGLINALLAVFNLVPAAPLDGGRVLRALLWHRHGDRLRAAVTAANAGRVFGSMLVGFGVLLLVAFAELGGVWFMLIGWFLITAASAEAQHAQLQGTLADVRVCDVMTPDPVTAPQGISVSELLDAYVLPSRFATFPLIADGGRPVGLVTLNRIKRVLPANRATTTVDEVAWPLAEVATATPDEPLADLLPRLVGNSDGRALVLEGGRVVGIVSPSDIARQLMVADLRGARDLSTQHV